MLGWRKHKLPGIKISGRDNNNLKYAAIKLKDPYSLEGT